MAKKTQRVVPDGTRVLALDVASSVGYAFGAGGGLVEWGKYSCDTKDGMGRRLVKMSKWISKVIHGLPVRPEVVVVEAPYMSRNAKTYAVLNKYVAVIQREVRRILNVECVFISPHDVKRTLKLPKAKATQQHKKNMIAKVNKQFDLRLKYSTSIKNKSKQSDDDTADAIGLLWAYWIKNDVVEAEI